jgi:hypothetical protein
MRKIPLLDSSKFALVDSADFGRVSRFKWRIKKDKRRTLVDNGYVVRTHSSLDEKTIYLSRFLLRFPAGKVVDHRNHNREEFATLNFPKYGK